MSRFGNHGNGDLMNFPTPQEAFGKTKQKRKPPPSNVMPQGMMGSQVPHLQQQQQSSQQQQQGNSNYYPQQQQQQTGSSHLVYSNSSGPAPNNIYPNNNGQNYYQKPPPPQRVHNVPPPFQQQQQQQQQQQPQMNQYQQQMAPPPQQQQQPYQQQIPLQHQPQQQQQYQMNTGYGQGRMQQQTTAVSPPQPQPQQSQQTGYQIPPQHTMQQQNTQHYRQLPPQELRQPNPIAAQPTSEAQRVEMKLRELFNKVDKNHYGRLSENELSLALLNTDKSQFQKSTVQLMIKLFDKDGTGTIDFRQFYHLWNYISHWRTVFRVYDKDKSNTITFSEYQETLKLFGYTLSTDAVLFVFQKFSRSKGDILLKFDGYVESLIWLLRCTNSFKRYDTQETGVAVFPFEKYILEILGFL